MNPPPFVRRMIAPKFFPQHATDLLKVRLYVRAMLKGEVFPPVVVARYGDSVMPLDGHHRLTACRALGRECDALECDGEAFEDFALEVGSAEADRLALASVADQTRPPVTGNPTTG